jgi:CubicO group peptidase (beta-lactamase class C family)
MFAALALLVWSCGQPDDSPRVVPNDTSDAGDAVGWSDGGSDGSVPDAITGDADATERDGGRVEAPIRRWGERLVREKWTPSLSVAVLLPDETVYYGFGKVLEEPNRKTPDRHTRYEIGSITKPFTATLFAEAVERGAMDLEGALGTYLPDSVTPPTYNGTPMTTIDLATHHSGLPVEPTNIDREMYREEYANYSAQKLYSFLEDFELSREPGSTFEYSNVGMGLLGHLVARQIGPEGYPDTAESVLFDPLGLEETVATPVEEGPMPRPHNALGEARRVAFGELHGAGAIRSSARDLAQFLRYHMAAANGRDGDVPAGLASAMRRTHEARRKGPFRQIGLAWFVGYPGADAESLIGHSGRTYGFSGSVIFEPEEEVGAVVLTNSNSSRSRQLAQAIVQSVRGKSYSFELPPYESVSPDTFSTYTGTYELTSSFSIAIFVQNERLFAQATDQPPIRIYPSGDHEFHARAVEARFEFSDIEDGKANSVTLRQNGVERTGTRVSD